MGCKGVYITRTCFHDVKLPQPAKIKIGGSYDASSLPFEGSIVCFAVYDTIMGVNDFGQTLNECDPSQWPLTPSFIGEYVRTFIINPYFGTGLSIDLNRAITFINADYTTTLNNKVPHSVKLLIVTPGDIVVYLSDDTRQKLTLFKKMVFLLAFFTK